MTINFLNQLIESQTWVKLLTKSEFSDWIRIVPHSRKNGYSHKEFLLRFCDEIQFPIDDRRPNMNTIIEHLIKYRPHAPSLTDAHRSLLVASKINIVNDVLKNEILPLVKNSICQRCGDWKNKCNLHKQYDHLIDHLNNRQISKCEKMFLEIGEKNKYNSLLFLTTIVYDDENTKVYRQSKLRQLGTEIKFSEDIWNQYKKDIYNQIMNKFNCNIINHIILDQVIWSKNDDPDKRITWVCH